MQETCPTTQSLHISTNDVPYGYLSPDSISSDETCDSDTSDASWPVISPVTSEDEHSAKTPILNLVMICLKLMAMTQLLTFKMVTSLLPAIVSML